ncbi:type VI secretion system tip protein VgrG [Salmonella enterica]|nr:type VI secretion system tip protein VgrG [Salmonella enterica subsp. enterica serovar Orientalis]EBJ4010625.1 type VI secretion system tip protein VgrG [Salmonella enterica]EBQ9235374.1 type VI secretion system tip protein VgrG [Salmonella enterica subsp. enterica serovar Orientalis]EKA1668651.1 type VI secretion system tip protein VgrG [Salmonella enterica]
MSNRITVQLPVEGLLFWKLSGHEAMSEMFELSLTLLSTNARLDRSKLLGQPVTVTIPTQNALSSRYFNGKITRVAVSAVELSGTRYAAYQLTVEPDLWPMKRDRNLRIFQGQTVPQIINTLLREYQVNVEDKLNSSYRVWDYCVQYQESSFAFIRRLMELEGIAYHFRHEASKHTMVLTDSATQHQPVSGYETIPYHQTASGGITTEEGIGQWALEDSVTPGIYSLDDYDFRKPNAWLFQARQNPVSPSPGSIDVYDWPGRFVDHGHGEFYSLIRQERWQVEHQQIQATATAVGIAPGATFTLTNAPFFSDNGEYLTTTADYFFAENSYASGGKSDISHQIHFRAIPSSVVYRPAQVTNWPRTYGPQTAKVVGPEGESIWTDRYGRIKVKFHWDRHAKDDDTDSCWVRVSSIWASQGFGGVQIPRVGDEVVIDFINGDPDRPIVIGRVYNETSMPPWDLPGNATRMGFMTRSKDGNIDNSSFLFFEDNLGNESVEMHSEKDMKISVENDKTVKVDGNRITSIMKEQKDDVTGDGSFYYRAKRFTQVDQEETTVFNNSQIETIKNGRKLNIISGGDSVNIKDGRDTKIEGTELHHVTDKITEKYENGQETVVFASGKKETIDGGLNVLVNTGNWTQTVQGGSITIFSPQEINIISSMAINMKAPKTKFEPKLHNLSVTALNESFTGNSFSMTGASESFTIMSLSRTGVSLSHSNVSISYNTFGYSKNAMELKQIKTDIKSGDLSLSSKKLTSFL